VGEDVQIAVLVRNGSTHSVVIGDPTGAGDSVRVALVCSHLGGLANWSLPVVGPGTTWVPGDDTGIVTHEVVRTNDIGQQTCQVGFVRGGSEPRLDPISNSMVSHDVTIVAPLPHLRAVRLLVVAAPAASTSTNPSATTTAPVR